MKKFINKYSKCYIIKYICVEYRSSSLLQEKNIMLRCDLHMSDKRIMEYRVQLHIWAERVKAHLNPSIILQNNWYWVCTIATLYIHCVYCTHIKWKLCLFEMAMWNCLYLMNYFNSTVPGPQTVYIFSIMYYWTSSEYFIKILNHLKQTTLCTTQNVLCNIIRHLEESLVSSYVLSFFSNYKWILMCARTI